MCSGNTVEFSHQREGHSVPFYNIQETRSHHANSNKPVTKTDSVWFHLYYLGQLKSQDQRTAGWSPGPEARDGWQGQTKHGETFLRSLNVEDSSRHFHAMTALASHHLPHFVNSKVHNLTFPRCLGEGAVKYGIRERSN